jgi:hypothetical protein
MVRSDNSLLVLTDFFPKDTFVTLTGKIGPSAQGITSITREIFECDEYETCV